MNKRLERVETARKGLVRMYNEMHDCIFEDGDMLVVLENGYVFFIQGFTTRESFEKAKEEALAPKNMPI